MLLWRDYRGDVRVSAADRYLELTISAETQEKPIFVEDGITYVAVKHKDLIRTMINPR